jgi:hypothetical protein
MKCEVLANVAAKARRGLFVHLEQVGLTPRRLPFRQEMQT